MHSRELKVGGVVLCGGRSSRMGQPKALLPVGSEVMLQRVVRRLSQVVSPIVVVAAADQDLPEVDARIARDPVEYRGPLAGLAVGLAELRGEVEAVYLTACDVPLLTPEFVAAMIRSLGDAEIAVPKDEKFHHPLAAVYRTSVSPVIDELLRVDQLRPVFLFDRCVTNAVSCEELRSNDPDLDSLTNANTPAEYARILTRVRIQDRPLPAYAHTPRITPHPISDPAGHSFGQHAEPSSESTCPFTITDEYLWGRRLFQHCYYWEAHEAWETLWITLGRTGPRADLVKALIKLAAAGVKMREGNREGYLRHLARAEELLTLARPLLLDPEELALADSVLPYPAAVRTMDTTLQERLPLLPHPG